MNHHHQQSPHHFNTPSSDDDFLEQTLSSCSWPDLSTTSSPLPWDLRQIAAGDGTSSPSPSPAMSLLLQQQLLMSRGLASGLSSPTGISGAGEDSGVLPMALSLGSNGDCFDRSRNDNPSFDSPNQVIFFKLVCVDCEIMNRIEVIVKL